jgi:EmrB/QacA subfamily drug resistance transporter
MCLGRWSKRCLAQARNRRRPLLGPSQSFVRLVRRSTPLTEQACRRLTLAATVLGSSMASVTAITVALPEIRSDFGIGFGAQQWIVLSYSLSLASLYLVAGALGDRLGRRRMFISGTAGFALASALAGAAPGAVVLILARVLQGAAGALLTTGSLSLLRSTFGSESGRAIGIWATGTGAVSLGGPPLGGALVEWASWRWIFFLNVPLALTAVSLAWVGRRASVRAAEPQSRLDVLGAGLVALAIGSLAYGLVQAGEGGFADVGWSFALAGAALAAFLLRERRTREPLLPLSLFRSQDFALVNVATLLIYSAVAGSAFFLVLFLQSVVGYTAFEAGLLLLPSTLAILFLAARFGRLSDRLGPRPFLVAGPVIMAVGMLLWLRVDDRSLWDGLLPGLVLYGLGLSMIVAPITAAALTSAPERYSGLAAGVNATFSRLGSLLAIAILGVVASVVFAARTDDPELVPFALDQKGQEFIDGSTDAFRAAMVVAALLALAGALTALGYSRPPEVTTVAEDAEAAVLPPVLLDPATPDCPAALVHHAGEDFVAARQGRT